MNDDWRFVTSAEHTGPITAGTAWKGMFLCLSNARSLFLDALLLHGESRHASAAALATIALEEGCKWVHLLAAACALNEKFQRGAWKEFRHHKAKLTIAWGILRNHVRNAGGPWGDFDNKLAHLPRLTSRMKEQALYVALMQSEEWSTPSNAVGADGANAWLATVYSVLVNMHIQALEARILMETIAPVTQECGVTTPADILRFADSEAGQELLRDESSAFDKWRALAHEKLFRGEPKHATPE